MRDTTARTVAPIASPGFLRPAPLGTGRTDHAVPSRHSVTASAVPSRSGLLLALFFLALLLPINIDLGGLRMTPSRLFLLICAIPFGLQLLGGKAGRLTVVDGGMLACVSLMIVTLLYHHGTPQLAYALSQAVEVFGGYMAGRVLIRSVGDYHRFIRYFLIALMIMLPLAIYELYHYRMVLADVLHSAFSVVKKNDQSRFGLSRVQVVFPHSILYGLFCSLALASVYYIYKGRFFRMVLGAALVIVMTGMSLSSGPLISVFLQTFLILWDKVTRGAWKLLAVIAGSTFLFLEIFSNRGPVIIFIEKFTLDPATGWWRIYIWRFGTQSVQAHPFLGIGLNDWDRPSWLTYSVDNFWLLMAMRYGVPCLGFLLMAFILHITFILRAKGLSDAARMVRKGYAITLVGLSFTLATVFIWDAMAVFVMFFLGAGAFLYAARTPPSSESQNAPEEAEGSAALTRPGTGYSRFPQTPGRAGGNAAPVHAEIGQAGTVRAESAQTSRRRARTEPVRE
jgi:hypothetical protein